MQAYYPAEFEREMGCTEADWLAVLPGATGGHALAVTACAAQVVLDDGALQLQWRQLSPRQIALMRIPRLWVSFRFENIAEDARQRFMRHFDLYTQRGGG
jgi:hypothetical protein